MPNGHGGIPKYGSPILLLIGYVILAWHYLAKDHTWAIYVAYLVSILFGWRLSYHMHMYDAMEYGGAFSSEEKLKVSTVKYKKYSIIFIMMGIFITTMIWFMNK